MPTLPPQNRTRILLLVNSIKLQDIKIFIILKQSQRKEGKKRTKFIFMKPLIKKKPERLAQNLNYNYYGF